MVSECIVSYLVADHARLHALLDRAMAGSDIDLEAFANFRRGLLRHIAIEKRCSCRPLARRAGSD
jgi:hypothetical protein